MRKTLYAILPYTRMTRHLIIWRTLPIIIIGSWFFYQLYKTVHEAFFLDSFILLIIAFIGISLLIWSIYLDIRVFKDSKKYTSFLPSILGLAFVFINYALYRHQDNRMNSPSLISGFNDGGFNGFSVDFKKNGSYVMANGNGLGQSYFYGTYWLKDSIITIDKKNVDNCIKTNRLVIRSLNVTPTLDSDNQSSFIIQIDSNGRELNSNFWFRVTEDNRNQ
jgi:hypothetical protein